MMSTTSGRLHQVSSYTSDDWLEWYHKFVDINALCTSLLNEAYFDYSLGDICELRHVPLHMHEEGTHEQANTSGFRDDDADCCVQASRTAATST